MRKDDLKNGMVVERRDGERRLVLLDALVGMSDCEVLDFWSDNLTFRYYNATELDIVKVYRLKEAHSFNAMFKESNLELIWGRKAWEQKKYPVLTRLQYEILEKYGERYNWMARNTAVGFYRDRPIKPNGYWEVVNKIDIYGEEAIATLPLLLDTFDFIKAEELEPQNIQELLDNCEVVD